MDDKYIERIMSWRGMFKGLIISEKEIETLSQNKSEADTGNSKKIKKKKYIFESLGPVNDVELGKYEDALNQMMEDDSIYNVGLTGPYGAGKSSIIESYKTENEQMKFIHVALGKYDTIDDDSNSLVLNQQEVTPEMKSVNQKISEAPTQPFKEFKEIEGKIINQLLHQVNVKNVPQAFTKVKKNNSVRKIIVWAIIVPLVLAFSIFLLRFDDWAAFVQINHMNLLYRTINPSLRVFAAAALLGLIGYLTYVFGSAQINRSLIRKVSIRGNEIELFKNSENSFFDEHLNEVIYLFENSGADVIVFEDLDRFGSTDVFRKLRELNQLINKRKQDDLAGKDTHKKLVFLYLIKDDIFVSKDRTKFFDLIIPVVPTVSSSNSFNKMMEIFGSIKEIDRTFLRNLSFYIDDMRLIKNIFNEYTIYDSEINTSSLDQNKLLGMVTYKNIFPRDFSQLQYGKGFIYSILNNKRDTYDQEKSIIDSEIFNLESELEELESSSLVSFDRLKETHLTTESILVDGESEDTYPTRMEYVRKVLEGKNLSKVKLKKYQNYSNLYTKSSEPISLESLLKKMEDTPEYQQDKKIVEDIKNGKKVIVSSKIQDLKIKKKQVETQPLSEVFDSNHFEKELQGHEDIKNSGYYDLILFLLSNGYIDENYEDYMNYFYPNDLKREDKLFVRNLLSSSKGDPSKKLRNIESLIEILKNEDYKKVGILNFSLSEYIIDKKMENQFSTILSVARQNHNYKFVLDLYENLLKYNDEKGTENILFFTVTLFSTWKNFLSYAIKKYENKGISEERDNLLKDLVFDGLIYLNSDNEAYEKENSILVEFINQNSSLLENVSEATWNQFSENGITKLEKMEIKLTKINHEQMYNKLFKSIIKNDLYEFNYENIEEIALFEGIVPDRSGIGKFKHESLTRLMNSENDILKARIKNNLNDYLNQYLLFSDCDTYDIEEYVLLVLNSNNVADKTKIKYIESMKYHVENLEEINNKKTRTALILNNKVVPNIQNIIRYFQKPDNNWNKELINFVNQVQHKIKVDYDEVIEEFDEIGFFEATLALNELRDNRYEDIIGESNYKLTNDQFTIKNLQDNKISLLLKHGMISMNSTNLENIRENYRDILIDFIQSDIEAYLGLVTDQVNESEIIGLLNSNLSVENMDRILSTIGNSKKISLAEIKRDHPLMQTLIAKHLKESDKKILFSEFNQYIQSIKNYIVNIAIESISIIIDENIDIDKELLKALLLSDMEISTKKDLVINKVDKLHFGDFLSLDSQLGLSEKFEKINLNKNPSYDDNPFNSSILERLVELNLIKKKHRNGKIFVSKLASSL
ncbi:hypothetical protein MPS01_20810 [Marinilactibacillus psychrotolerans]|uniref:YobI-like P-loop NTPase domain-containing protein n=1 Tax=Marinilactibacillus psychrotolerans TaxID=191770 RepID=A0AAV3WUR8_9LACT|nr:hypothetical protein MPS01_20810 [Marinilactibacillus psychrotolerans]GEQ35367.1 hypothetical protein M132T_08750 [Marinilactibacillus psychrotolerans]SDD26261.1 hypothetical protein SAMN04488013_1239 [Marinilactibacillus psychrotolerans]